MTEWVGETVPIGRPVAELSCRIGDDGELLISGPQLATGYLDQPDLTAGRFRNGPSGREYRTGDRVHRNPAGDLEFLGRLDSQLKISGIRIEPGEIESALLAVDGIEQAGIRTLT
ncbi:hypothetical protein GCM10029976_010040 [Kribbella albertanoniae]